MNDTSGCAKNVHYGDILVKFGESISAEKADLPFICEREILKKLSKSILKNGDVVIADTAEDMTTGKSCEIVDVDECMPVLAGLHTIPVRPKQKFGKYYLGYYLNSEAFHSQLIPLIQGIKVYSISKSSIKDTVVMFPDDVQEQEKIGSLFNRIDNTITLQQRKLNSLQKLKKGLLQKMFPKNGENIPEIRFPEFSDAWKQRKLEQIIDVGSGRDYKHLSEGGIPVYGTGGYMLSVNEALSWEEDAIGIGRKGTIDKPYILQAPFWTVDTLFYAIPKKEQDLDFLYCIFQNIDWKKKDESTGVPSLSKTIINKTYCMTPNYDEQKKIGCFFSKIDNLITLQQCKLESLQKLKKGLLQQMFI